MRIFEIPLSPEPQTFTITLSGRELRLTVRWFEPPAVVAEPGGWVMDMARAVDNAPIVAGVPLVTGADLLEPYAYLGIKGQMRVFTDGNRNAVPTLDNLGTASHLLFGVED